MITSSLKKLHLIKVATFAWYSVEICVIFGVRCKRVKVYKKSKPTRKLNHANSILDCCEHLVKISSKLIVIILSYSVSKLVNGTRALTSCEPDNFVFIVGQHWLWKMWLGFYNMPIYFWFCKQSEPKRIIDIMFLLLYNFQFTVSQ